MQHAVRNYAIVTAAYWGFTLTDGARVKLVERASEADGRRP